MAALAMLPTVSLANDEEDEALSLQATQSPVAAVDPVSVPRPAPPVCSESKSSAPAGLSSALLHLETISPPTSDDEEDLPQPQMLEQAAYNILELPDFDFDSCSRGPESPTPAQQASGPATPLRKARSDSPVSRHQSDAAAMDTDDDEEGHASPQSTIQAFKSSAKAKLAAGSTNPEQHDGSVVSEPDAKTETKPDASSLTERTSKMSKRQLERLRAEEREAQKRESARLIREQKTLRLRAHQPATKSMNALSSIFARAGVSSSAKKHATSLNPRARLLRNVPLQRLQAKPMLGAGIRRTTSAPTTQRTTSSEDSPSHNQILREGAHIDLNPVEVTPDDGLLRRQDLRAQLKKRVIRERRILYERDEAVRRMDEEDFDEEQAADLLAHGSENEDDEGEDDAEVLDEEEDEATDDEGDEEADGSEGVADISGEDSNAMEGDAGDGVDSKRPDESEKDKNKDKDEDDEEDEEDAAALRLLAAAQEEANKPTHAPALPRLQTESTVVLFGQVPPKPQLPSKGQAAPSEASNSGKASASPTASLAADSTANPGSGDKFGLDAYLNRPTQDEEDVPRFEIDDNEDLMGLCSGQFLTQALDERARRSRTPLQAAGEAHHLKSIPQPDETPLPPTSAFVDGEAAVSGEEDGTDEDDATQAMVDGSFVDHEQSEGAEDAQNLAAFRQQQRTTEAEAELAGFSHLLQNKRSVLDEDVGEDAERKGRRLTKEERRRRREIMKARRESRKRRASDLREPEEHSLGSRTSFMQESETIVVEDESPDEEEDAEESRIVLERVQRKMEFAAFRRREHTETITETLTAIDEESQQVHVCMSAVLARSVAPPPRTTSDGSSRPSRPSRQSQHSQDDLFTPPLLVREHSSSKSSFLNFSPKKVKRLQSMTANSNKGVNGGQAYVFRTDSSSQSSKDGSASLNSAKQARKQHHPTKFNAAQRRPALKRSKTAPPTNNIFARQSASLREAMSGRASKVATYRAR
ncbi:uncharacterized protein MONBRDRAFT_27606 [Monosiga brevicollis MX1]|uniref:Uncharacterized protein n=1 Tax=Monosiga brevicollis TaxID=81824 RepID=A9V5S4_MONBE|nr:uncharacterized protein MONBRDRAFT_27606 [Monosiga brevicollis MX1]EDQ87093.1 predicted protein [Monosiga brevicollis MX1]|eukprot:XP_001748036.1 hypothetical protein [Monosiga brevicollis MX1]